MKVNRNFCKLNKLMLNDDDNNDNEHHTMV